MIKKICIGIAGLCMLVGLTGCAGINNDIAKNGSLIGSTNADYVIVNYSGNKIMDVWKLKNVYVKSENNSDGWNFIDSNGNVIMLGGDVKVIRIKNESMFDTYKEYHYEFNGGDYYEFAK